jgi:hypothetical protein
LTGPSSVATFFFPGTVFRLLLLSSLLLYASLLPPLYLPSKHTACCFTVNVSAFSLFVSPFSAFEEGEREGRKAGRVAILQERWEEERCKSENNSEGARKGRPGRRKKRRKAAAGTGRVGERRRH